jgi:hypothetical protein
MRFLALFVKLALQTNRKNGFEKPAVSALTHPHVCLEWLLSL